MPKTRLSLLPLGVLLAMPAVAAAQPVKGTIISVDRPHHVLREVESQSTVQSLRYRGRLPRKVRAGSVVRLAAHGHVASKVRYVGRAHRVQFVGHVVQADHGKVVLSLPDGRPFAVDQASSTRVRAAGDVSLNLQGLEPGQAVLITITFSASGDVTISIQLVAPPPTTGGDSGGSGSGSGDGGGDGNGDNPPPDPCGEPNAIDGKVLGINRIAGSFTIRRGWDDTETYSASPDLLARIHETDQVLVLFDPANDSAATDVRVIASTAGSTPDPSVQVADGVVNWVGDDAGQVAIVQTNGGGRLTFDAACWVLNQVWTSEDVHVVYHQDPSGDLVIDAVDANDGSEL